MDTGILTNLSHIFINSFGSGYLRILPDAQHLLSILAALEIFFAAIWWAFDEQKAEVELLKKVMLIGFFIFVVNNYQWLIQLVIKGFITTGQKAGGGTMTVSLLTDPSLIIDYGFAVTSPIFEHTNNYSTISPSKLVDMFFTELSAILILLAFFALAILVFITYLEFYLVSVLGLILVPFGVFKHTSFLAEKVFGAVIAFGIRLMVLAFILSATQPTLASLALPPDPPLKQVLILLLTAVTIGGLSWHAPAVASGLMAGSPALGIGTVFGTAIAAATPVAAVGAVTAAAAVRASNSVTATRAAAGGGGGVSSGDSSSSRSASTAVAVTPASGVEPTSSSLPSKRNNPSVMPGWAQTMMIAGRAIPPDAHPGAGMSVPLRQ